MTSCRVTGGELLQRFLHEDALTESDVAFYIRQLLLAIEHMHSRHIVHLDLKVGSLSVLLKHSGLTFEKYVLVKGLIC